MNNNSLSRLYRQLTAKRTADVEAGELVAAVSGEADSARREAVAAKLGASAPQADLARLLNALQPASAELAEGVRRRGSAHPQRSREARPLHHGRRVAPAPLRWAGGMAACLAAVLGVVGVWHGTTGDLHRDVVASASTVQRPETIFSSNDRIFVSNDARQHSQPSSRKGDELFRSGFPGG